jgi:hypothetical protein
MSESQELKDANARALRFANRWDAALTEYERAKRTLLSLGYRDYGGECWKPSLGDKPTAPVPALALKQGVVTLASLIAENPNWQHLPIGVLKRDGAVAFVGLKGAVFLSSHSETYAVETGSYEVVLFSEA